MIRVYGTITSPYVRRVRIVAAELGLPVELQETLSEAGQARLRELSPIWKVPAAEIDGQVVFDSHVITALLAARAQSPIVPALAATDVAGQNLLSVADGALDALINAFTLARDSITPDKSAYVKKQHERAASSLAWLEQHAPASWTTEKPELSLPEVALGSALAWLRFRDVYPITRHPRLVQVLTVLERRPSFASTQPSA
jgi:glutathione S-transferase